MIERALARAVLIALGLAGCAAPSLPSSAPPNATVVVRSGRHLQPPQVEVRGGERVQWINETGGDVVVNFQNVQLPLEGSTSRPMYRFEKPGRYEYVATATSPDTSGGQFVAKLRGEVVVKEPTVAATPAPAPAPPAPAPPPRPAPAPPAAPPDPAPSRPDIVRVRGSRETLAAYGYQARQGLVVRAERGLATPVETRAGEPVILHAQYSLLSPVDGSPLSVRETWVITQNDQELGRLDKEATLGPGTYESQQRLVLPADAPPGTYVVRARVEALAPGRAPASDQTAIRFTVRPR